MDFQQVNLCYQVAYSMPVKPATLLNFYLNYTVYFMVIFRFDLIDSNSYSKN